ncbi:hypothetical protein AGLY_006231 [Aphis glycines]|uniref:Uncharacterized protein n=1 Tax=Aphis glycines TaxID=307491 RepID=A0A6G0TRQ4_APHGL|nr:hypothetical protein AGLY_006231 [Aphis glycines]
MKPDFSKFIDDLNYVLQDKENFGLSKKKEKPSDKCDKKKNDDEIIGVTESVNSLDNLMLHCTDKPPVSKRKFSLRITENEEYLSTDNDIELIPKKKKLIRLTSPSVLTSHNKSRNNKCISNNNNSSISCREKKLKFDLSNNVIDNMEDDRNSLSFNNDNCSDEIFEELEKELMELGRLPTRKKSVNLNDDISTKCKFFIKNFKKCQSTAIIDTKHMPEDLDLLNYIKHLKSKFKSLYKPKRTRFYKKLVKTPEHFEVFNLKEGYINIAADKGMVNLYDALKSFEKKHQYTIKFVKSNLGDALKRYTANRDVCWDVVHLESNTEEDLLKYRLCYGAIPDKYILELEIIVCRLLLSKLHDDNKTSTDNVKQLVNRDYDLLEGELELLVFNYWQKSTRDMFEYKEDVNRKKTKMVFYYMYKQLETNILLNDFGKNENRKLEFINILKLYKSYAAFENQKILTAASLAYVKNSASKLVPFLGEQYKLWSVFFMKFKMHSTAFEFTIKALLKDRDNTFQYLFTRVSEIDQFNISESAKSLWYYGLEQKVNPLVKVEDTVITKTDVVNCLGYYFSKPKHVPRALCVKLDNYYFLYIHLFITFIINNNLYKYQKKLTVDNCKQFFILNDRRYHNFYWENFIPTFETKRMVIAMKTLLNNQLNARLDGDIPWKMTMDSEVIYMFFELVHLHLNYTLTPAILREGPALTDVQWASIFISDIDKMEMFYLNGLRWDDKPWMLGGAPDDLDYNPETEDFDDDPLKQLCSDMLSSGDATDDEASGYEYSSISETSTDEETDFNSDDSEVEVSLTNDMIMEKKMKRLLAEKQQLSHHKIFPKKIRSSIEKVSYLRKPSQIKSKVTVKKKKKLNLLQVENPALIELKGVQTLKIERCMIAGGVLDVYELKNNETYVTTSEGFKTFGLLSKNSIKTGSRSSKRCALCPNSKIASYSMSVSENVAIRCCLMCIKDVANYINSTKSTFEKLQNVLINRIHFRFKSPILFDEHRKILKKLPPLLSSKDLYYSTFNIFDPKYGKRLSSIDVYKHYSTLES